MIRDSRDAASRHFRNSYMRYAVAPRDTTRPGRKSRRLRGGQPDCPMVQAVRQRICGMRAASAQDLVEPAAAG